MKLVCCNHEILYHSSHRILCTGFKNGIWNLRIESAPSLTTGVSLQNGDFTFALKNRNWNPIIDRPPTRLTETNLQSGYFMIAFKILDLKNSQPGLLESYWKSENCCLPKEYQLKSYNWQGLNTGYWSQTSKRRLYASLKDSI